MTAENFTYAELRLLREICTRDFSLRQRLVLFVILQFSFGRQRGKAYLRSLQIFFDLCLVGRSHVSETLKELKALKVIGEDPPFCYGINVTWAYWGVPVRHPGAKVDEQLYFDPPGLEDALREIFVVNAKSGVVETSQILSASGQGASLFVRPEGGASAWGPTPARPLEGLGLTRQEPSSVGGQWPEAPPSGHSVPVQRADSLPQGATSQEDCGHGASVASKAGTRGGPEGARGVPEKGTAGVPEKGTAAHDPVPEKGTLAFLTNIYGPSVDAVPEKGTGPAAPAKVSPLYPPSKAVNVNRSPLNAKGESVPEKGTGTASRRLTRQEEARLMELIGEFVGADDMRDFGGSWRVRWVRNVPDLVEEFVGWGKYLEKTQGAAHFESKPKWLTRHLCIAAGVSQVSDMPIGPRPL
jgi:hypothetical protein